LATVRKDPVFVVIVIAAAAFWSIVLVGVLLTVTSSAGCSRLVRRASRVKQAISSFVQHLAAWKQFDSVPFVEPCGSRRAGAK
jgi:hypothetical protein